MAREPSHHKRGCRAPLESPLSPHVRAQADCRRTRASLAERPGRNFQTAESLNKSMMTTPRSALSSGARGACGAGQSTGNSIRGCS